MRLWVIALFAFWILTFHGFSYTYARKTPRVVQASNPSTVTSDSAGKTIRPEVKKRSLLRVTGGHSHSHEDYSDLQAPPGLPEAQHGPVVFSRKKKRGPHHR